MMAGELIILFTLVVLSAAIVGLGVPLLYGGVPPNGLYGFRNAKTLKEPTAWYAANRVFGFWLIMTGTVTMGVAAAAYAAQSMLSFGLFATLVTLMGGVIVAAVQSDAASRRGGPAPPVRLRFGLFALFLVTTLVAIGCAITRLPGPWVLKTGLLWAYLICIAGMLLRNVHAGDAKS